MRPIVAGQLLGLAHVQAGGRLVEQQQRRLAGQRARQLDEPLLPVGEAHRLGVREVGEAEEREDLAGSARARRGSSRTARGSAQHARRGSRRACAGGAP